MSNTNLSYYLGFSHCLGIGPMKFDLLMKKFKSVEVAYKAKFEDLSELLGQNLALKFNQFRNEFNLEEELKKIEEKKITVLTREDKYFPKQLLQISDKPICLYVKGSIRAYDFDSPISKDYFFAIVGTRKPTSYGQQITRKFAKELSSSGFVIVSGLAIGVDSIAHQGALDELGRTIAFLGCGVDIVYPSTNKRLYEKIIENEGLIISEFPPGMTVLPGLFIARNRLISGLSRGVLVVEGAADSGALITARYAAEQGKEVFAPPSPITSEMSVAPNMLLKQGAKLVTAVEDIFEELNLKMAPIKKEKINKDLNKEEKAIFDILTIEPRAADELAINTEMKINLVLQVLSTLEVKGIIEKNSEGKYQVR